MKPVFASLILAAFSLNLAAQEDLAEPKDKSAAAQGNPVSQMLNLTYRF